MVIFKNYFYPPPQKKEINKPFSLKSDSKTKLGGGYCDKTLI